MTSSSHQNLQWKQVSCLIIYPSTLKRKSSILKRNQHFILKKFIWYNSHKLESIWEQGEYRFLPEPCRLLRIFIDSPNYLTLRVM